MFQALISFFKTTRETFSLFFLLFRFISWCSTEHFSKISSKLPTQEFKLQKIYIYFFPCAHICLSSFFTRNENEAKKGNKKIREPSKTIISPTKKCETSKRSNFLYIFCFNFTKSIRMLSPSKNLTRSRN